jgi:hypothetical protein
MNRKQSIVAYGRYALFYFVNNIVPESILLENLKKIYVWYCLHLTYVPYNSLSHQQPCVRLLNYDKLFDIIENYTVFVEQTFIKARLFNCMFVKLVCIWVKSHTDRCKNFLVYKRSLPVDK